VDYIDGTLNLLSNEGQPPRIRNVAMWTLYNVSLFAPQLLMVQEKLDMVANTLIQSIHVDHQRTKEYSASTLKNLFMNAH